MAYTRFLGGNQNQGLGQQYRNLTPEEQLANAREEQRVYVERMSAAKTRVAEKMEKQRQELEARQNKQRKMAPVRGAIGGAISGGLAGAGAGGIGAGPGAVIGALGGAALSAMGSSGGEIQGYGQLANNAARAKRQADAASSRDEKIAAILERQNELRTSMGDGVQAPAQSGLFASPQDQWLLSPWAGGKRIY